MESTGIPVTSIKSLLNYDSIFLDNQSEFLRVSPKYSIQNNITPFLTVKIYIHCTFFELEL